MKPTVDFSSVLFAAFLLLGSVATTDALMNHSSKCAFVVLFGGGGCWGVLLFLSLFYFLNIFLYIVTYQWLGDK